MKISNTENTPAKALGNFLDMIQRVELNENYKPSNPSLVVAALKTLHADASAALDSFHSSKAILISSKKERVKTVEQVKATSMRVVNFLKACGAERTKIEQAMTIYRMIHGYKSPGTVKPVEGATQIEGEEVRKKSTKQGSQDSLVQNFQKLIQVLKTEVLYNPNEKDLSIEGLEALVNKFKTDDLATATADAAMERAKVKLTKLFDDPRTGVNVVMPAMKLYSKAAFGAKSPEYAGIVKIKHTKVLFR
jgi:hypothetical protein